MLEIRKLKTTLNDIPSQWVFENYLNIESLQGQSVKMKSIFNSKDREPSMIIYYDTNSDRYKFKDFSSGKQGDGVELVKEMFNYQERHVAADRIVRDYINLKTTYKKQDVSKELAIKLQFKITDYKVRQWNNLDKIYWNQYGIGSKMLEKYNIKPIESYVRENINERFDMSFERTYGFFDKNGELFKLYSPGLKKKFSEVKDYIQGIDQLDKRNEILIWTSSMKDIMAIKALRIGNINLVASNSENVIPKKCIIDELNKKHKYVFSLYDNDTAGMISMKELKNRMGIDYIQLKLSKDPSDSIKDYGKKRVREEIINLLKEKINGK